VSGYVGVVGTRGGHTAVGNDTGVVLRVPRVNALITPDEGKWPALASRSTDRTAASGRGVTEAVTPDNGAAAPPRRYGGA